MTLLSVRSSSRATGAVPVLAWIAAAVTLPACGGVHRGSAAQADASPLYPAPIDPGSGPVDCTMADGYEMHMIEDFEFGAATGWYTNNEVCYPWTQAAAECADSGVVCYPGSQVQPNASCHDQPEGGLAMPGVWSSCFGNGQVNCQDPNALNACRQECLDIQPSPPFLADQLPASKIPDGGRCGSLYALNIQAGPFANWGGNVGTRFSQPVNATVYDGIAVWMRTGPGYSNSPRITLSDMYTDSQYNMSPPDGGVAYCNPNPNCAVQTAQGNANCYNVGCDTFGAYSAVIEDWRLFVLPFSEMRQGGWGKMRPFLDLSQLLSIQISYPVGTWDLWVDDIAFYRLKPQ